MLSHGAAEKAAELSRYKMAATMEIAAGLNADKVPTPGVGKNKGEFWRHTLVYRTLVNRGVLGEYQPYREIKTKITRKGGIAESLKRKREKAGAVIAGYYPRIISEEVFGQHSRF